MNGVPDMHLTTTQLTTFVHWKRVELRIQPIGRFFETRPMSPYDPLALVGQAVEQTIM